MSEDLTHDAPETPAEDQTTPAAEPTWEDRALTMGWTPKEQFKGDPERFVDAETFVKRGEDFLPFVKANNKRLEGALERSNTKIASLEKTLERFAEHHTKTEQRAYERAVTDLRNEIAAASARGDVQGVLAATDELTELQIEAKAGNAAPKPPEAAPEEKEAFDKWAAANSSWWGKDDALTAATIAIANRLEKKGYTGEALVTETDKQLRAEFPSKFENPNRKLPGAVEGSGAAPRRAGKTYSDLPPEGKAICDDFVKRIPGFTREQYVKDFFQ